MLVSGGGNLNEKQISNSTQKLPNQLNPIQPNQLGGSSHSASG